jgi:hypothetical protein
MLQGKSLFPYGFKTGNKDRFPQFPAMETPYLFKLKVVNGV